MNNNKKTLPELLAPAGNMERLEAAVRFGADAVYLGARSMSLRNYADNFTFDELSSACRLAHGRGSKVYVAVNAFARDRDIEPLPELICSLKAAGADALIVSDPGVIRTARRASSLPLHLSTQANTLSTEAVLFWRDNGIKRVILARELSLDEIKRMRDKLPCDVELEMFIHGAMCVSYSGRCLLSNYLDGRDSSKGECVQPCRWNYELREKGKNGEWLPIEEDGRGTYILNSRDMNLMPYLDNVLDTGVSSVKIEGRMKSVAYVATVVNAYRMALDALGRGEGVGAAVMAELDKASHRPYTSGFALGAPGAEGQHTEWGGYITDEQISAVVESYDSADMTATIVQRNRFFDGDTLNILSPGDIGRSFTVNGIVNEAGESVPFAPHPKERLIIGCTEPLLAGDILRKPV